MEIKGVRRIYTSQELSDVQRLLLFWQTYRNGEFLHLRLLYRNDTEDEFRPGRGIVLPKDPRVLHELGDAFHAMADDFPWKADKKDPEGGSFSPEAADNTSEGRKP